MGSTNTQGFTIIETLLFLGVTGVLAVGLLVGSGAAIGQQRYRDSVNSLKSTIQQQFSDVANTTNARSDDWSCDSSGNASQGPGGQTRGTSDCVMMGRVLTIKDGVTITASNVVGYRTAGATGANDIAELAMYNMTPLTIDQDVTEMNWQSVVVQPHTATPASYTVLILRSPLTGSIKTFVVSNASTYSNLNALVTAANQSNENILCVAAPVGTFIGSQMGVRISALANNQGAISIPLETEGVCG